jgi:glycosyltransferase involved in cell wall biosynthesis
LTLNIESLSDVSSLRILAVVEATTVNAVAKNVLEFQRSATDLKQRDPSFDAVETTLVSFDRGNNPGRPNGFVTAASDLGLELCVIPERFRFDTRVISALRKIVEVKAPDIVLTHQVKSHLLMSISRLPHRFPWVAFHHGYTTTDRKMRAYNLLNRWSLPKADRVITVCEAFARDLRVAGVSRERIHVQHNSIRPEERSESEGEALRTHLGVAKGKILLLSVGRLSREKGHIDLMSAFRHLQEIYPDNRATLVIVGDGPERANLTALSASLNLGLRVILAGQIDNVSPFYTAADIVVLPSHSEGSPYVLLEAMAARVPVVATAVGGVPEMVKDEESALLVPARDPRRLAMAIARLLAEPKLAHNLTENAATLVGTRYAPDTQVRSLVRIFRSVLEARRELKTSQ